MRSRSRSALLAWLTAALMAIGACGGGDKPDAPLIDATTKPTAVTLSATGAVSFEFTGNVPVQRILSAGSNVPQSLHLLSIAIPQPQKAGANQFRAGFNLYGYAGSAAASIPPFSAAPAQGLRSIAFLDLVAPATRRFDRAVQACSLVLQNGARRGDLVCPELADAGGAKISLRIHWDMA